MADIQVDVFEVQLGAAFLLQMRDSSGEPVRVLADAGIKRSGSYGLDHVEKKLPGAIAAFSPSRTDEIDLLIGTHYDEDHLAGLPDVVRQFNIGEAMLPPVRRPASSRAAIERAATAATPVALVNEDRVEAGPFLADLNEGQWEEYLGFLILIEQATAARIEQLGFQVPPAADDELPDFDLDDIGTMGTYLQTPITRAQALFAAHQLASVRMSSRKGAIVAKWLREVVRELKAKNVPIRSRTIQQGTPDYFVWDASARCFRQTRKSIYDASGEPSFTLLGPSAQLVARHSTRLPIGVYALIGGHLVSGRITASNELSYVALFESAGQQALVCGDAGCVDFWQRPKGPYHPALLSALKGPSVVQVAHHGGSNYRFYDVLLNAPFHNSSNHSYLLLSHAYQDRLRPTADFELFVQRLQQHRSNFHILFTSEPDRAKVLPFQSSIHPVVGVQATTGDVRLSHNSGAWTVDSHSIHP